MSIKNKIKHFMDEDNPLVQARRKKMRQGLRNQTPTLLCPNCLGGILFHDLGLKFQSPTVNLMLFQTDFAKFVLNLDHYLAAELEFYNDPEYPFPCAKLDDIVIHFTHYKTEADARAKWYERCGRIDRENLFILLSERDGLTREMMERVGTLQARGLVIFTANEYPDLPYTLQIPKYAADGEVGNILAKNRLTGEREYEQFFDFVKWFNEADGGSYDISRYRK